MDKYFISPVGSDLKKRVKSYFDHFNNMETYNHTIDVLREVESLSQVYDFDVHKCKTAALLHDVGNVVEASDMVEFCEKYGLEVLEGEKKIPMILHQKASRIIAERVFGVSCLETLNAISYHSTSRPNATLTEMVLLVCDKLSWRDEGYQDFVEQMRRAVSVSIKDGVLCYLNDLYNKRDTLEYYHPYAYEALEYFNSI